MGMTLGGPRCCRSLGGVLRARRGTVAILTALGAPALVMMIGMAIDFGYASYINQRLAKATDSAVLAAVSQTAATEAGGYSNTVAMQAWGQNVFQENVRQLGLSNVTFNITVQSDGNGGVIANGNYAYPSPTFFGGLFGISSIPLANTATTTARPPTYVNYYILVDISQSMGIASTQADMNALYQRTQTYSGGRGDGACVFACHVPGTTARSYEDVAHNMGTPITLRIDAAQTAISNIITTAQNAAGSTKNIAIGLYTLQANPSDGSYYKTLSAPSTDYPTLQTLVNNIDLGPNNGNSRPSDTDYPNELAAFNRTLPANGNGASASSPINYVFLVTDGVSDVNGNCANNVCTGPLDYSYCAPIKLKSTLGVIYTTYRPIWANNDPSAGVYETRFKTFVLPFYNQISPALQNCASSSDYFLEADNGSDIINAMQALFSKTLPVTARLTQ